MTALTRTPQNTNNLQASKFLLTFSRIPDVQYFCQTVNIPGVSIGSVTYNTPLVDLYSPGTKITHNNLNIDFIINEGAEDWKSLFEWFRAIAAPESIAERNRLSALQNQSVGKKPSTTSDAILTVMSALNNPILRVHFVNVFPTSLGDIQFDTRVSAEETISATATFSYDYFTFSGA